MNKKLAFIGGGNMSYSMIGGLLTNGFDTAYIAASDPSSARRQLLTEKFSIRVEAANSNCVDGAEIVVLAVKPQNMKQTLESISAYLITAQPVVISIAAGVRIREIISWSGGDLPVIRAMPNIPALINFGVSGLYANSLAGTAHKKTAETIMQAVGKVVWVNSEDDIDTVTGISGSGPAYFFRIMEIMIDTAQKSGLDKHTAQILVLQTALGAAKLAEQSPLSPGELRQQVTSPQGTTEVALESMNNQGIATTIETGILAAVKRSYELSTLLGEE